MTRHRNILLNRCRKYLIPGPDSKTIGIIYRVGELMMNDKDYSLARYCFSIVYDITQETQLKTLLDELDKDLEAYNA